VVVPALKLIACWASPPHLNIACYETRTMHHPHRVFMRVPGDEAVRIFSQVPGSRKAWTPGARLQESLDARCQGSTQNA